MLQIFRSLLYLYPAGYRREFGDEMDFVLREAQGNLRQGFRRQAAFCVREMAGLLCGSVREHFYVFIGSDYWTEPRRSNMRRFPRSMILLMIVILAGVMLSIEAAKRIVAVQMKSDPSTVSVWGAFPGFFTIGFGVGGLMAVSGWAVLFALRRSGIHRLSDVQTWPDQK